MDSRHGGPPAVLVVVLFAAVVGVVGAVLAGAAPSPQTPHAGELIVNLPMAVWGLLFLAPLLAGLGALILRRMLLQTAKHSRATILGLVVVLALALLFVFVLSKAPSGSGMFTIVGSSGNYTAPAPGSNNSSGPPGSVPVPTVSVPVPGWALMALVAGLAVVVGTLAIPGTLGRILDPRRSRPAAAEPAVDPQQVQQAIAEASRAIERGDDPRQTIIHLYLRLLEEFSPRLGNVDHLTAEEIRGIPLARLHVRPDAAEALTRLFEEARYSTHPVGPADASRCLAALRAVEADLSRPAAAA